jgi:hypothetical protein
VEDWSRNVDVEQMWNRVDFIDRQCCLLCEMLVQQVVLDANRSLATGASTIPAGCRRARIIVVMFVSTHNVANTHVEEPQNTASNPGSI